MPGAFPPVPIQRPDTGEINVYVDGGLANGTPVGLAVDAGVSDITVVLVTAAGEATDGMLASCHLPPRTFKELLLVCQALMQHKIISDDLALAASRGVTIRVIRPHVPLKATVMGFDDAKAIDAAIEAGYRDAQQPVVYAADASAFVA